MNSVEHFVANKRNETWFCVSIICIACAVVMSAYWVQGIPSGYDVAQHLRFADAYRDAFQNGSFRPIWAAYDNLGYGSIGIRFYPPLSDAVLAVTQLIVNDWYLSLQLNSFFWMFPGCIGIFFLCRQFIPAFHAVLPAVLYSILPYHVSQIYQMQIFAEFVAASIIPFCFLFAVRVVRKQNAQNVICFAICLSLLLLTHIPTSIVGLPILGIFILFLIDWGRPKPALAALFGSGFLSLGTTAFFLVRVFSEIPFLKHNSEEFSTGFYNYQRHFFPLYLNYGDNYWMVYYWVLDVTILATILPAIVAIVAFIFLGGLKFVEPFVRRVLLGLFAISITLLILISPIGAPIWSFLPILQKIQFPWRLMSLFTFVTAVILGLFISFLFQKWSSKLGLRLIGYGTLSLLLLISLFDLTQVVIMAGPMTREKFDNDVISILGKEGCSCWWPVWAEKPALDNLTTIDVSGREADVVTWDATAREFIVGPGAEQDVRLRTFYYPLWKARINDRPAEIGRDENGAIVIHVSSEASRVRLNFEEPFTIRLSGAVSAITWLTGFAAILFIYGRQSR